jgi:K+-sensing histidine kinase KdpD
MNSNSITKLRKKFIWTAVFSFTIVMLLMGAAVYGVNLAITRSNIRAVMEDIVANDGYLPLTDESDNHSRNYADETEGMGSEKSEGDLYSSFSFRDVFGIDSDSYRTIDSRVSTRYFAILYDEDGEIEKVLTNRIAAIKEDEAVVYAQMALKQHFKFGSFGTYYYYVADRPEGGTIVVYLDSTTVVLTNSRLLFTVLILVGLGLIIAIIVMRTVSWKIVQPEIKNAEIQKEFITNASHELKTPLAVIRANTEAEQMINGENEWNQSTMRQVDRMTGLIQNLVMVSRAQEKENNSERKKINVSAALQETSDTFLPVAVQNGKKLEKEIQENVMMTANESQIRQLSSLLIDNAIKYCDDGGTIRVTLTQKGRSPVRLDVSNNYAKGGDVDYARFFERFYRQDKSHNIEKGGYGIGLSIAQAIVEQYKGSSIDAAWKDGIITFTCLLKG